MLSACCTLANTSAAAFPVTSRSSLSTAAKPIMPLSSFRTLVICRTFVYPFSRFTHAIFFLPALDRLVGLVVKASASGAEDPGFESRLRRDFSGLGYTSDLKIGTPVATLPGAWRNRVSAGTGRPGVSIL